MKHYLYITDDIDFSPLIENGVVYDIFTDVSAPLEISIVQQLADYAFYTFGDVTLSAPNPLPFLAVVCSLPDKAIPRDVFNTYNYVELPIYPKSIKYNSDITSLMVKF